MKPSLRLALLLALAGGLWVARERLAGDDLVARATPARRPAARPAAPAAADLCTTPAELPQRAPLAALGQRDPFTGLGHDPAPAPVAARTPAAPPAPPPVVAVVAPPAPAPAAEPAPPRLPYRMLGRLDEKNGDRSVFLGIGPALIAAHAGETLEGGFRLDAIGARELTFTHLATQKTVRMAIEGDVP